MGDSRQMVRLRAFLATREGRILAVILLGAVAIRLPLMAFLGYYGDLKTYIGWGDVVNQHFWSMYTSSPNAVSAVHGGFSGQFGFRIIKINYPPGTPYLYGVVVFVYNHLLLPVFHESLDALAEQSGMGPFIAKVPMLAADLAAIIVLYRVARKRHTERFALLVAASYAFSPAVLYNGAIWGQTDALVALPVLVALFALISERYALAGTSLAIAVLLKPQPVIFVPLVLLYICRWGSREQLAKFAGAGLLTALVAALPILAPHFQLLDMLGNMQAQSFNDNVKLSSDAFNFWWLIGYGQQPIGSTILGAKSGRVGDLLFAAVTLLCGVQIWRHSAPISLFLGLAVQLFGFFMFMGSQHERYLFLFIPLVLASLIVAKQEDWTHLVALYAASTALCLSNMFVGVGGGSFGSDQPIPFVSLEPLSRYLTSNFAWLSTVIALLQLATFAYALGVYLSQRQPRQVAVPPAEQLSRTVVA